MKFICKDPSGDRWHYDDGKYIRMRRNKVISRISSENLPDPLRLWQSRSMLRGSQMLLPEDRPTDATFALYKHKEKERKDRREIKERQDNQDNNSSSENKHA